MLHLVLNRRLNRRQNLRTAAGILFFCYLINEPFQSPYTKYLFWLGYLLIVIGGLGRVLCSIYIGGKKNECVVQEGPFSIVRNPLYLFSFIATMGIGLQLGSLCLLTLLIGGFLIVFCNLVSSEEHSLQAIFGEPYAAYMNKVPRWIPNLNLWTTPTTLVVKPTFVWQTMRDAGIFFLIPPGLAIINMLHANHVLPVLTKLP